MTTAASERRICTNKLLMDIIEFDKALFDTSNLSVDEIKYFNSIIDGFNNQTQFYIDWLDSDEARRIFYENEQYNDHTFAKIDEQIKEIVHDTSLKADEIISHIYDSGLQAGADEIKRTRYYNDATKYGLHFLQSYNFELISNVNDDLKNHIREEIFVGIAAGEGMPEVAKRILDATNHSLTGKTLSARQRAMMIARTESARAMTQGRLQSYANYGVHEVKILTAGDDNVCAICREAETKIYLIEDAGDLVPFHPLCRCSVMAYIRHGILQGNPDDNAPIINLTPLSSNFSGGSNSNTDYKLPTNISEKQIQSKLKDVVDYENFEKVSKQLFDLINMIENPSIEYGTSMTNTKDIVKLIQTRARRVDLPNNLKEEALKKGILTLMHSHPEGESPLGSDDDFLSYALYRAKYGLSFNGFGIFFIENNRSDLNKERCDDISESIANIAEGMETDFRSENPDAKRLLEEDESKYYADLHDFVNSNHDKYFDEYVVVLKKYGINVTFINW